MNPTQTGIATALALVVIVACFVYPGFISFTDPAVTAGSVTLPDDSLQASSTTTTTTMPTETQPITQLMIKDTVVGTGGAAQAGDMVTVNYVGALTNGTVFDASANHGSEGFTFKLGAGQVIKGWDQGIVGMKVGGKRMLAIPADMAYGNQAVGSVIPANSALIFEVELLKVAK